MSWPVFFVVVLLVIGALFMVAKDQEKRDKCRAYGGEVVETYRSSWTCVGDGPTKE